jgi:hypothetical protein
VINFEPMAVMNLATLKVAANLTEASLLNNSPCLAAGLVGFVDQKYIVVLLRSNLAVQQTSLSCQFVTKKFKCSRNSRCCKFTFARKKLDTLYYTT